MRSPQEIIKNKYIEENVFGALFRDSLVEVLGDGRVLIENHKGICSYDACKINLCVSYGILSVCGHGLKISFISHERMVISGKIEQLILAKGDK